MGCHLLSLLEVSIVLATVLIFSPGSGLDMNIDVALFGIVIDIFWLGYAFCQKSNTQIGMDRHVPIHSWEDKNRLCLTRNGGGGS